METPYTNHLTRKDYEFIYEPAQDTFLLLDALEADLDFIIGELKPTVSVEIGTGSGVIITALAKKLKSTFCLGIDINDKACQATKNTAIYNKTILDVIHMDVTKSCMRHGQVDLLVFNPPYVPTEGDDATLTNSSTNRQLIYSWDGGSSGRNITDQVLSNLKNILSPNGVLYLLLLKENHPNEIIKYLKNSGFDVCKFMERKIPGEHLYILKIINKIL